MWDDEEDDEEDDVDEWLAAHPGFGHPALTPELLDEMAEDEEMGYPGGIALVDDE